MVRMETGSLSLVSEVPETGGTIILSTGFTCGNTERLRYRQVLNKSLEYAGTSDSAAIVTADRTSR